MNLRISTIAALALLAAAKAASAQGLEPAPTAEFSYQYERLGQRQSWGINGQNPDSQNPAWDTDLSWDRPRNTGLDPDLRYGGENRYRGEPR